MRKKSILISNRSAYNRGFEKGINLALDVKKINFKSLHPLKALVSPAYLTSHIAGIRDGYRQGLWKYEKQRQEKRLRELSRMQVLKDREKEHER